MRDARTLRLLRLMESWGGSFASALATAWLKADADNAEKLDREFRPLLETYTKFMDP